jgi:hypothetical protein
MYECIIFGRKNLNDTITSLSILWKKKKKKIVIQLCGQSRTWNCDISFGVSTRFRLKFQPSTNVKLSAERTSTTQLFHYLLHETNKYKKSFKFAALRVNENATFLLGFQRGFGWNFNRIRTNVWFSSERNCTIQLFHYLSSEKKINK